MKEATNKQQLEKVKTDLMKFRQIAIETNCMVGVLMLAERQHASKDVTPGSSTLFFCSRGLDEIISSCSKLIKLTKNDSKLKAKSEEIKKYYHLKNEVSTALYYYSKNKMINVADIINKNEKIVPKDNMEFNFAAIGNILYHHFDTELYDNILYSIDELFKMEKKSEAKKTKKGATA